MWYTVSDSPMQTCRAICACIFFCCSASLFLATPASGFCFQPHPSLTCDFLNSDAVFTGRVISVRPVEKDGSIDGYYYRLSVLQLFRGPHERIIEVYTGNDSGGYYLDSGKEYLIFASTSKGELQIGNCDDSAPLSKAKETIRQIQKLAIPKDGIVEGQVALHQIPSEQGLAGVQILIRGGGKSYTATTDDNGWFRIHVPPGAYSAEAKSTPAHLIINYDLSYDGPDGFAVKAGRCADLQFVANSRYTY
ncbi:MAG: hypothetical protein ACYC93_04995 [Candidatus Acidiferrales bacterium]